MVEKTLAGLLLGVVLTLTSGVQNVWAQTQNDLQTLEKVKAKVREIGVNGKKRVEVKLKNNSKYKGNIRSIEADSFTIADSKTGTSQNFTYSEVKEVKKTGGISPLTWGIIAGAAVAVVIVSVVVLYPVLCDGGAGC